uniref:protein-serine/threonine phosphatase n=1 Tax=viral metagenome TaxID=1070528 RepID=A0A6C0C923_9ZZZZ
MQMNKPVSDVTVHKSSILGRRESNEDVEYIERNLAPNGSPIDNKSAAIDLFIICDGHGGDEVSKFVVPQLREQFLKRTNIYPLRNTEIFQIYNTIQQLLKTHPKQIADGCGSTALVIIRHMLKGKKYIQVINIGDCRAVLSRKGLAIPLSKDHKPDWPDEKRRIKDVNRAHDTNEPIHFEEKAWRIGDLSVSRAFGDLDNVPYVTHIPEIFNYPLTENDEFIIMACDGLWDVMSSDTAVNFVRDHMTNSFTYTYDIRNKYPPHNDQSNQNIGRKLADYAFACGSTDNISVLLLIFN